MRKTNYVLVILTFLIFGGILSSCSSEQKEEIIPENTAELEKLPENFPLQDCPIYSCAEIVSVVNQGSETYFSYEITFNSFAEYEDVVLYYETKFPDARMKDFGVAYSLLSVPQEFSTETKKYYMCNYSIFSGVTKGTEGSCTVTVSVSEY